MLRRVLASAWTAIRLPSVIVPSAAATLGSAWAFRALDAGQGFWGLPVGTMTLLALLVIVRFYLGLCVSATTLAVARANNRWRPTQWVPATTAFEVGAVTICLAVPIFAGLLFLVVPGVWLAIRWSQAAMVLLDRRASWFESADASAMVVKNRYLFVLGVWCLLGGVVYALQFVEDLLPAGTVTLALMWAARVIADAFNLAAIAALYRELADD